MTIDFCVPVVYEVIWEENKKGSGVVAHHSSGMVIFPARDGYVPPSAVKEQGAKIRKSQPVAGQSEMCVLWRPEERNTLFAYPCGANQNDLDVDEMYGFHHVIDENGDPVVTVFPDEKSCVVARRSGGKVVIEVEPIN